MHCAKGKKREELLKGEEAEEEAAPFLEAIGLSVSVELEPDSKVVARESIEVVQRLDGLKVLRKERESEGTDLEGRGCARRTGGKVPPPMFGIGLSRKFPPNRIRRLARWLRSCRRGVSEECAGRDAWKVARRTWVGRIACVH